MFCVQYSAVRSPRRSSLLPDGELVKVDGCPPGRKRLNIEADFEGIISQALKSRNCFIIYPDQNVTAIDVHLQRVDLSLGANTREHLPFFDGPCASILPMEYGDISIS